MIFSTALFAIRCRMSSSSHQWFVQTDFGALLGPMPADVLAEMARTGALLRKDQVREGTDGEWRSANDLPGLFEGVTPPHVRLAPPNNAWLRAQPDGSFVMLTTPEAERPRLSDPNVFQEASSPRDSFKIASSARMLDDLLKTGPDENSPPSEKNAAAKSVAEELDFEVDVPLVAPATAADPPPVFEHITVVKPCFSTPSPVSPQRAATEATVPVPTPGPPQSVELPPPPNLTAWESPVPVTVRRRPTSRMFSPKPRRWKRTLATWSIVAAVSVVLVAAWWFWPRQRPDIYAQYVAIYKELQQRRDGVQGQAGWNEFVARANAELDECVSWLDPRAKPGDREKSLLLYAGRDLQEMLEHSRDPQRPHQKRLDVFFEQLQEMSEPKK